MAVQTGTSGEPDAVGDEDRVGTAPLFGAYVVFGAFWGVWVVVFADFLAARGLSEGEIGLRLGALSITSIVTMTLLAPRLNHVRLGHTLAVGLAVFSSGALLLAAAGGLWVAAGFAAIGIGNGLIDVFVNVGGQLAEVRRGRPVLQYVHAAYNVGGILGAVCAGVAHTAGVDFRWLLAASGIALLIVSAWCARSSSLRERPAAERTGSRISLAVFLRSPALLVPAVVVLSAFLVEGSMDIWSVIYLRETIGASALAGALAFSAFSLAMVIGRVTAARLLFGFGYRATLTVSGLGTLAAGALAALANDTTTAAVAFLLLGFFISSAAPAAFGLASETDVDPVLAIAGITTVGYTGFVVGPPIMGWLAEALGLRATMSFIVAMGIGVILGGILAPSRHARHDAGTADPPPPVNRG